MLLRNSHHLNRTPSLTFSSSVNSTTRRQRLSRRASSTSIGRHLSSQRLGIDKRFCYLTVLLLIGIQEGSSGLYNMYLQRLRLGCCTEGVRGFKHRSDLGWKQQDQQRKDNNRFTDEKPGATPARAPPATAAPSPTQTRQWVSPRSRRVVNPADAPGPSSQPIATAAPASRLPKAPTAAATTANSNPAPAVAAAAPAARAEAPAGARSSDANIASRLRQRVVASNAADAAAAPMRGHGAANVIKHTPVAEAALLTRCAYMRTWRIFTQL